MRTITKTLITTFLLNVALKAAPPVLNVYVIPFDNLKNDVAIGWLSDALSEMINSFGGITININKDSEKILLTEKISSQIDLGYVGQIKNVDTNFLINALHFQK